MTYAFESTDWGKLRDVNRRLASAIPRLLLAMRDSQPAEIRQEAAAEFAQKISDGDLICDAAAPALEGYFELLADSEIRISANFLYECSTLFEVCGPSDKDDLKTGLMKSAVKTSIQSQAPLLRGIANSSPNSIISSMASDLLIQFGAASVPDSSRATQSGHGLENQIEPPLGILGQHGATGDWEKVFLDIVEKDQGEPRFQAAARLVIARHESARELMSVLLEFPLLKAYAAYKNLLFEACAALGAEDRTAVLEKILKATEDTGDAVEICRQLLAAVFQVELPPLQRLMSSGREAVEYTWLPKRPYRNRKRLTLAERVWLSRLLVSCDPLWREKFDLPEGELVVPVHTNLWRQFGLPSDRESIRELLVATEAKL